MNSFVFDLSLSVLLGLVVALAQFARNCTAPLSGDEGYLWYGALRAREGRTPIRDFRAYEPGRYYVLAFLMHFTGTRLHGFRLALYLMYGAGLTLAALACRMAGFGWIETVLCVTTLSLTMPIREKGIELTLAMLGLLAGVVLLVDPSPTTFAVAGFVAGLITIFGLNYGLYVGAALGVLTGLMLLKSSSPAVVATLAAFGGGLVGGLLPLAVFAIVRPGFLAALIERRLRMVRERRTTNLPLPIPWPWHTIPPVWGEQLSPVGARLAQVLFFLVPVVSFVVLGWALVQDHTALTGNAIVVSAAAHLMFVQHHAWSRADPSHLGIPIQLLVIASFALMPPLWWVHVITAAVWVALWALTLAPRGWRALKSAQPDSLILSHDFGDALHISRHEAQVLVALRELMAETGSDRLFVAPCCPQLFPLLGVVSPVYDIYCIYPQPERHQARMIGEIERHAITVVLIFDFALDDRDDLRFPNTHPLVAAHVTERFAERIMLPDLHPHFRFYLRPTS